VKDTALEDVARLVAPRRVDVVLRILRCFQGKESLTREEIICETGLGEKTFEYYLTKLRYFRLVQGFRSRNGYHYYISVDGFHSRIDTLFVDPVRNLRGKEKF
jgi:hypothetical protein